MVSSAFATRAFPSSCGSSIERSPLLCAGGAPPCNGASACWQSSSEDTRSIDCRRLPWGQDLCDSLVSCELAKRALAVGLRATWNLGCKGIGGRGLGVWTFGGGVGGGGVGGLRSRVGYRRAGSLYRFPRVSGEGI